MTKDIFISHAWGIDEQGIDNHKNCKDLCNKLIITAEFINLLIDLGLLPIVFFM